MSIASKLVLICDLVKLARLTGSLKTAYCYLKQTHPLDNIACMYRGVNFHARRGDWPALREVFLNDEYGCLESLFTPDENPAMLDLGAHIGSFALQAFSYNKGARIVSVEAAQNTGAVLEQNCALNPTFDWQIIHGAIWKENVPVYLDCAESSLGNSVGNVQTGEQVEGVTPDSIIEKSGFDHMDFVKMDIEGAEEQVIPVSGQLMANTRYLLIEIHNDRIKNAQEIFSVLNSYFPYVYKMGSRWSEKPVFLFCKNAASSLKGWKKIEKDEERKL
jgi:FkbM family methyltransferase